MTMLAIELLSRNLRRSAPASASVERAEYSRRDRDMLWYLLRGSIWQEYTRYVHMLVLIFRPTNDVISPRPKIESFTESTARTPILGLLGALVKDWMPLIDDYYYCACLYRLMSQPLTDILLQTHLLSAFYIALLLQVSAFGLSPMYPCALSFVN